MTQESSTSLSTAVSADEESQAERLHRLLLCSETTCFDLDLTAPVRCNQCIKRAEAVLQRSKRKTTKLVGCDRPWSTTFRDSSSAAKNKTYEVAWSQLVRSGCEPPPDLEGLLKKPASTESDSNSSSSSDTNSSLQEPPAKRHQPETKASTSSPMASKNLAPAETNPKNATQTISSSKVNPKDASRTISSSSSYKVAPVSVAIGKENKNGSLPSKKASSKAGVAATLPSKKSTLKPEPQPKSSSKPEQPRLLVVSQLKRSVAQLEITTKMMKSHIDTQAYQISCLYQQIQAQGHQIAFLRQNPPMDSNYYPNYRSSAAPNVTAAAGHNNSNNNEASGGAVLHQNGNPSGYPNYNSVVVPPNATAGNHSEVSGGVLPHQNRNPSSYSNYDSVVPNATAGHFSEVVGGALLPQNDNRSSYPNCGSLVTNAAAGNTSDLLGVAQIESV